MEGSLSLPRVAIKCAKITPVKQRRRHEHCTSFDSTRCVETWWNSKYIAHCSTCICLVYVCEWISRWIWCRITSARSHGVGNGKICARRRTHTLNFEYLSGISRYICPLSIIVLATIACGTFGASFSLPSKVRLIRRSEVGVKVIEWHELRITRCRTQASCSRDNILKTLSFRFSTLLERIIRIVSRKAKVKGTHAIFMPQTMRWERRHQHTTTGNDEFTIKCSYWCRQAAAPTSVLTQNGVRHDRISKRQVICWRDSMNFHPFASFCFHFFSFILCFWDERCCCWWFFHSHISLKRWCFSGIFVVVASHRQRLHDGSGAPKNEITFNFCFCCLVSAAWILFTCSPPLSCAYTNTLRVYYFMVYQ